ncbi:hypothetical protein DSI35_19085, partial [Mycobacterium tuberculosis]
YDGSNRLTVVRNAGGAAIIGLGYDVQGNLSIKNGQGYQFDFGNRLRVQPRWSATGTTATAAAVR